LDQPLQGCSNLQPSEGQRRGKSWGPACGKPACSTHRSSTLNWTCVPLEATQAFPDPNPKPSQLQRKTLTPEIGQTTDLPPSLPLRLIPLQSRPYLSLSFLIKPNVQSPWPRPSTTHPLLMHTPSHTFRPSHRMCLVEFIP
jgi:hypothetical protein